MNDHTSDENRAGVSAWEDDGGAPRSDAGVGLTRRARLATGSNGGSQAAILATLVRVSSVDLTSERRPTASRRDAPAFTGERGQRGRTKSVEAEPSTLATSSR